MKAATIHPGTLIMIESSADCQKSKGVVFVGAMGEPGPAAAFTQGEKVLCFHNAVLNDAAVSAAPYTPPRRRAPFRGTLV
jgi:hypothetical protein